MENKATMMETFFEKAERYSMASMELYKLKAIDKSSDVISTLIARLAVILSIALFFLILNIGIALWVGEMLGKSFYGFFIVAGFYALVGALLYAFRDQWIKIPLRNSIITQALS